MFNLISKDQLNTVLSKCQYFSSIRLMPNKNGVVIRYKNCAERQRYLHGIEGDDLKEFNKNTKGIYDIFILLTDYFKVESFYIYSYTENWFNDEKLSPILSKSFKEKNINTRYPSGIITKDMELINDIFQSALMYNSFPVFISDNFKFVAIPTDHLDLFIAMKDQFIKEEVFYKDEFINIEIAEWK